MSMQWLESEIRTQLGTVPEDILKKVYTKKDVYDIVYAFVCRKLGFNPKSEDVKEAFKKALTPKEPKKVKVLFD